MRALLAVLLSVNVGAVEVVNTASMPAAGHPGALHASPLGAWSVDAPMPVLRALELSGQTPDGYGALDAAARAAALAAADAAVREEASAEMRRLTRGAVETSPDDARFPVIAARLAQLAGPLSTFLPDAERGRFVALAAKAKDELSQSQRVKLEERMSAWARALASGRQAETPVEAAVAELARPPASLMTPGVARLRAARLTETKALVRPSVVSSGPLFRSKVALIAAEHSAKTFAARRLYRPLVLFSQAAMEKFGEFWRAYVSKKAPDRHFYRWSLVKALHKHGDYTGAFGHGTYKNDAKVLSDMFGNDERPVALARQLFDLRGAKLTPGLGLSGMSSPQVTPQSHLSLLYILLKLAKEQNTRLLHNTGEGSPYTLLGFLEGDRRKVKQGVIDWLKRNKQLESGSWDEARIVAVVDLLMSQRDALFAEFTPDDLARAQIVAQFGGGLNGVRSDDDEERVDFDKLAEIARSPFVAMIQFKVKQAAKRGAKVDPKKVDDIARAQRELPRDRHFKSPEVIADMSDGPSLATLVKATRALTDKPVSLKFAIGNVRDTYDKLLYIRDANAVPDHIQLDGAGKEFSPGSGNAPPEADTSLPSDQATIAMDAMLKKLGLRDRVFVDATGDVLSPTDAVHKLALGADGVCAARGYLGVGLGCVMAKKCDGREGLGCPMGIASRATSLTGLSMDPLKVAPKGYKAVVNWHKEYVKLLSEAGVTDAWKARAVLGLHNPLSPVEMLTDNGLVRPLDRVYTHEVVADLLRGVLTHEEVDAYVFGGVPPSRR